MKLLARMLGRLQRSQEDAAKDTLASLVLAAREDPAFKQRVMLVLNLPAKDREPLVRTAVEEMERRGEPVDARAAFLALAAPGGAEFVARLIDGAQ